MQSTYTKSPKTYRKIVYFSAVILLFICCLLGITYLFYKLSLTSSNELQYEQLQKKCTTIDERISHEFQDYLSSSLDRPVLSVNIFSTFFSSTDSDSSYFQKIRIDLLDHYWLKQDILNDIILFRISDDSFVSATRAGYSLASTYDYAYSSVNYADLHELVALEPFTSPTLYITANSRLYYVFPVYQQTQANQSKYFGFAALYINPTTFFDTENNIATDNRGTFLILKDNDVIFIKGENVLSEKAILNTVNDFREEQADNSMQLPRLRNFVSTKYSFYYTTSESNNLTFLYYEPTILLSDLLFDFENDLTKMYWIAIIILAALFVTLLLQKIFFSNHNRSSKHNRLNERDEKTSEYYIFKSTIDLLYGNISPHSLNDTLCNILNIKQPDKYTSCIIIEPEPLAILKMTPEQKSAFMSEIAESVRMHSEVTTDTNFAVINYPQYKVTCVVNSNNFLPETLAYNILEHLKSVYNNCGFNVFCSTPSILISDLQRNYSILNDNLKYSYIYNYNNLFTQETLERFEAADTIIEPSLGPKIRQHFRDHNFDELVRYIDELPAILREKAPAYARVYDHYRSIIFTMASYCNTNYSEYPYKDIPPSDLMTQFESIDETSAFLVDFINSLKTAALSDEKKQGETISKKFIDRIIEYIDEHINDVSLNGVAEHFSVSVAHLSRVFKESVGINFSDYVAEKKLLKAVELLLDDTNYNISDIAKILGYNTPAYFSRKFKERFELTPAMYRKQYKTDTK